MDIGQLGSWGEGRWRDVKDTEGVLCDGITAYLMCHNVIRILRWETQLKMNVIESRQ